MNDFEYVLLCFLVPIAYVVTYIAGKYDIVSLLCKRLEEAVKEYSEKQEKGEEHDGE